MLRFLEQQDHRCERISINQQDTIYLIDSIKSLDLFLCSMLPHVFASYLFLSTATLCLRTSLGSSITHVLFSSFLFVMFNFVKTASQVVGLPMGTHTYSMWRATLLIHILHSGIC